MPTKLGALVAAEVFTHTIGNAGIAAGTTWTPSYTNLTVGNGTVTATYQYIGRRYFVDWSITFGSTTSVTGSVVVGGFPVAATTSHFTARVQFVTAGSSNIPATAFRASSTSITLQAINVSGTYASVANISSTVPITWATGDQMFLLAIYEGVS